MKYELLPSLEGEMNICALTCLYKTNKETANIPEASKWASPYDTIPHGVIDTLSTTTVANDSVSAWQIFDLDRRPGQSLARQILQHRVPVPSPVGLMAKAQWNLCGFSFGLPRDGSSSHHLHCRDRVSERKTKRLQSTSQCAIHVSNFPGTGLYPSTGTGLPQKCCGVNRLKL